MIWSARNKKSGARHVRCRAVVLNNTNQVLINKVSELLTKEGFNSSIVCTTNRAVWHPVWKRAWRVELQGIDETKKFLEWIRPYLVSKQEQADLVLQFLDRRSTSTKTDTTIEDIALLTRCQELNRRGNDPESVETVRNAGMTPQMIQSELIGDYERLAEMSSPELTVQ
jgi:hypothetical protein